MLEYGAAVPSIPDHMRYPGLWGLRHGPDKINLLGEYLQWIATDEERLTSAASAMQWYPPGFHGLLVARADDPDGGTHLATQQLNFYDPRYPGDEGAHAHSRDASAWLCAMDGVRQTLMQYAVVPNHAPRFKKVPVQERVAVAMNIGDLRDGKRPVYRPTVLGAQLILPRVTNYVAAKGATFFASTQVHHAGFSWPAIGRRSVAISVHYKGEEEDPGLNTREGFIYKGLPADQADRLAVIRGDMEKEFRAAGIRLAPSTMLYPAESEAAEMLIRDPISKPPAERCAELILGGLATVQKLAGVSRFAFVRP
jgi:hypothetical protein